MILQRLYALAQRENLLDDPAFKDEPIPFAVVVGPGGTFIGLSDLRSPLPSPSTAKKAPAKPKLDKGQILATAAPHGNTANRGFARYLADILPRVLPVAIADAKKQETYNASRTTFWNQVAQVASETKSPAIQAIHAFGQRADEFQDAIRQRVEELKAADTDRCTFIYQPDGGRTILQDDAFRNWYREFFASLSAGRKEAGHIGICQVTGTIGPIPKSHPMRLQGIPGGMSTGVSLISFDKPAFGHYGLDGAVNASIGDDAANGYLRALDALLKNALPSGKEVDQKSRIVVGSTVFLYWTRHPADARFMALLENPDDPSLDTELAAELAPRSEGSGESVFNAVGQGRPSLAKVTTDDQFYMLALSANSARIIVRDYLEQPLPQAKQAVKQWFADLSIADTRREYSGASNRKFPLWQLVLATAFDRDAVAPDTERRLLHAALTGDPIPNSILAACLQRLRAEGAEGFRASRMALIKLILIRKEISVSEQLDPACTDPAYVYGRLLALFEQIQYAALGDVNANVVDKFYGAMSATPGLVLNRLHAGARNHLSKISGDKPGLAVNLEKRLIDLLATIKPGPVPSRFTLQQQALFALGFYHEKADRMKAAAERKIQKAIESEKVSQ